MCFVDDGIRRTVTCVSEIWTRQKKKHFGLHMLQLKPIFMLKCVLLNVMSATTHERQNGFKTIFRVQDKLSSPDSTYSVMLITLLHPLVPQKNLDRIWITVSH